MNCFGIVSRETGQRRVPAPPHITTGIIFETIRSALLITGSLISPRDRHKLLASEPALLG
ncbi:hypothetical protein BOSEA31B_12349 [Hyphomicrobiales bacterium]|nr:hypothetical protein BOSEA31B_12349 [Hyphomicrobiales bacterium]CAH1698128.1 hypothetical protein BOSEA1005_11173 [Hyphomicrobiales bacterium]CAI0347771.1 hypothetical protein BO1005MUT1_90132 [Hyphomicrobiales bacterium]